MKNNAFLLDSEVKEIITLYATGEWTQKRLAKKFKVHRTQISRIISKQSWCRVGASRGMKSAMTQIASNRS